MAFIEDKKAFRSISIGCLLTIGILAAIGYWLVGPRRLLNDLGENDQDVVLHSDSLQVYRIEGYGSPTHLEKPGDVLANVKPIAPPVTVNGDTVNAIASELEDSNYGTIGPSCEPNPGILFRFAKGSRHVEILFCGMCGALYCYGEGAREARQRYGSRRKQLLSIVQKLFPKDQDLQDGIAMASCCRFESS